MDNLFKTTREESEELFDGFDITEDIDNFEEEFSDKEIDALLNQDRDFNSKDFEDGLLDEDMDNWDDTEDIDNWDDTDDIEDKEIDDIFEGFDDDLLNKDDIGNDDEDDFLDI